MLTEHDFAGAMRETLDNVTGRMQPSADLGAAVRARMAARRRRVVVARVATVPLLAAVAVGAVSLWPQTSASHPEAGTGPALVPGRSAPGIQLAGYTLSFPAGYELGPQGTNCTSELRLAADEKARLVTTPDAACPLLIKSVSTALPPGVRKDVASGNGRVNPDGTLVGAQDPALAETYYSPTADNGRVYVPAKLPDGSTVYVGIEWGGISASSVAQLAELERGLQVQPSS